MKKDGRHDPIEFAEGGMPVEITTNKSVEPAVTMPEFGTSWHEDLEIKYIVSGTLRFYVDDDVFEAEAGDTVIVNPYESHASLSGEQGAVYHMILLLPSGFVGKLEGGRNEVYKAFTEGRLQFPRKLGGVVSQLVREAAEEAGKPYGELAVAGLLRLIFAKLFASGGVKFADESVVQSARDKRRLEAVLSFAEEHPEEELSLERVSAMCYMSKFYFSRFFKKTMRMGFHEYVDGIRRVKAEEMLLADDCKLEEIALAVGMKDEYYFSRWFKKTHGESPAKFRAKKSK